MPLTDGDMCHVPQFMATMVLGSGANTWLNLSTSAKTNSVLYSSAVGMEAAGSETNMSGVALSQLSNRTLTPTGHHFYWTSLGAQYWAMAGLFALPLPFEALAAEVRWMEVLRCQKLPSLAALLSLCWGPWGFSGMIWIGLAKYGLPSVLGTRMMWWHWAVVSRLQFAAAPSPKHVLLRRTTALEFLGLGGAFLLLLYYPAFDIYCIHTGQWDQKVVGRTGAVIMIILEWLLAILILNRYRRQVFAPPDSAQAQGVDRVNLYADTALSGSAVWGAHIVLHYLFLLPDMEHDRQLLSMTDKTVVFPLEAPFWSFTPYAVSIAATHVRSVFICSDLTLRWDDSCHRYSSASVARLSMHWLRHFVTSNACTMVPSLQPCLCQQTTQPPRARR